VPPGGPPRGGPPPSGPPPGGAPPPGGPPPEPDRAPGLGEQVRSTRDSARRLVEAHVDLARAEFEEIGDAVKKVAAYAGVAIALAISAALLLGVGLPMFLGEWIFGSIGWGILLGVEWLGAVALALTLLALEPAIEARIGRSFAIALVVGIVVGVIVGSGVTNQGWTTLANSIAGSVEAGVRPLAVATAVVGIIGAVVGLVVGLSNGGATAGILGLVVGAILGITIGALTAATPGPRVGAALGMEVGLIVWIILMVRQLATAEWDTEALKARYWPNRTIETTKETIEWARERMPLWPKS
jgi:hypothetical protein